MKINSPMIITPRLLPGVKVGDGFISLDTRSVVWIDTPEFEHKVTDFRPGMGIRGDTAESRVAMALSAICGFLSACAESRRYGLHRYNDPTKGEHSDLFPPNVGEWAEMYSDELGMLSYELEELAKAERE